VGQNFVGANARAGIFSAINVYDGAICASGNGIQQALKQLWEAPHNRSSVVRTPTGALVALAAVMISLT
jgi:hypothetical protein